MIILTVTLKGKSQQLSFDGDISKADTIIVISEGYFGYGESIKTAKENCIRGGAPRKGRFIAYLGDEHLAVNDFGEISAGSVLFKLGDV